MLSYIFAFFILAVVSAFLGFGNLAGTFSQVAKILSGLFLLSLIFSLIRYWMIGKKLPPL
jgi:uncharacterized membrane protein YtjA (UPF0391 family)